MAFRNASMPFIRTAKSSLQSVKSPIANNIFVDPLVLGTKSFVATQNTQVFKLPDLPYGYNELEPGF